MDGRKVGRVRRGREVVFEADPGDRRLQVRAIGIFSNTVHVRANGGETVAVQVGLRKGSLLTDAWRSIALRHQVLVLEPASRH